MAAATRRLGVVEQPLGNWIKAHRAGPLKGSSSKPQVTAEQMENSRLRAELARVCGSALNWQPFANLPQSSRFQPYPCNNAPFLATGADEGIWLPRGG